MDPYPTIRSTAFPGEIRLLDDTHATKIARLRDISGTPGHVIHLKTINGAAQTVVFGDVNVFNSPPSTSSAPRPADSDESLMLWPIASLSKLFMALAWMCVIDEPPQLPSRVKLAWKMRVNDLIKTCKLGIRPLPENPQLSDFLAHMDGLPAMNEYLFALNGQCIETEDEFLSLVSRMNRTDGSRGIQPEYGNGNYILAGFLLEKLLNKDLNDIMYHRVFEPLGMKNTIMGRDLNPKEAGSLVRACSLDSMNTRHQARIPSYQRTVGRMVLGAFSCIADLARFHHLLFAAFNGEYFKFLNEENVNRLWIPCKRDRTINLLGPRFRLNSSVSVPQSINNHLVSQTDPEEPELYEQAEGKEVPVIRMSGYVDGYSSTVYYVWRLSAVVIVLGNSSGPLDVADHIVHYLLQSFGGLKPEADIIDIARRSHEAASSYLEALERQRTVLLGDDHDLKDIAGCYIHDFSGQQVTIHPDGQIFIGGEIVSGPYQLVRRDTDRLNITATEMQPFGIETWSVWLHTSLHIKRKASGQISLTHKVGEEEREYMPKPPLP